MFKNKKNKIISFLICFLFIVSLISIRTSKVEADDVVRTEPAFELKYTVGDDVVGTPNTKKVSGIVNNDITITGEVTGLPFELDYPNKELVLVLDVSESMNESANGSGDNCKINNSGKCTTHNLASNHPQAYENSKINKLRKATNEFVKSLRNGKDGVNPVKNLKIAIVTYNSNGSSIISGGFIALDNTTALDEAIKKIVVSKETGVKNGTNTGEGLRKTLYLLGQGDANTNKSIILMSDGLPTYCTVVDTNLTDKKDDKGNIINDSNGKPIKVPNYYMDTTKEQSGVIWNSGSGLSDVYGFDIGYAKEMAKIIKSKNYKVYSIGYGLNDSGNKNLRSLHSEMLQSQMPTDTSRDEELGYYKANDKIVNNSTNNTYAIDNIFKKISNDLIEKYTLIDTNIGFGEVNSNFTLNIGGSNLKLDGLTYTKSAINTKPNKIMYNGNNIRFTYTIKGNSPGLNQNLYNSININYKWNNQSKVADLQKKIVVDLKNEAQGLTHGLYNGFNNGKPSIDENNGKEFKVVPEATYVFGASFTLNVSSIDVKLDVSNDISIDKKDIKVYKVVNNQLVELGSTEIQQDTSNTNIYNIKLKGVTDSSASSAEILIVYKGSVKKETPNNKVLSNNISINKNSKLVNMKTPLDNEPKLPDLF